MKKLNNREGKQMNKELDDLSIGEVEGIIKEMYNEGWESDDGFMLAFDSTLVYLSK